MQGIEKIIEEFMDYLDKKLDIVQNKLQESKLPQKSDEEFKEFLIKIRICRVGLLTDVTHLNSLALPLPLKPQQSKFFDKLFIYIYKSSLL